MQIFKIGIDSGGSKASTAFKPFHNILVNAARRSDVVCIDVLIEIEFIQLIFVVGGKNNSIEMDEIGKVKKIRGKKALGLTISISNKSWEFNDFKVFKKKISKMLHESFLNVGTELKKEKKVKNIDIFNKEASRMVDEMMELSLDNMQEKLTLVPEVMDKSYAFWKG